MNLRELWMPGALATAVLAIFLSSCGGGGGGATSSSGGVMPGTPVGPVAVEITLASAAVTGSASTAAPVEVSGASLVPTLDPNYRWPEEIDPNIAHVFMEVVKVSLLPSGEPFGGEDMDGAFQDTGSSSQTMDPDKPNFLSTEVKPPVCIDLLRLENGKKLARILNRFDQVPAGTYDKIRLHYRNVKVVLADNTTVHFHPTANSKFDLHFRQGHELVIPITTDTTQTPDGWIKFFRVEVDFVGLKIRIVGQGNSWKGPKVILRPQIFAEAGDELLFSVAGTADNVAFASPSAPVSGTFDVFFGTPPRIVPVAFGNGTTWAFSDDVLGHSRWIVNGVPNTTAVEAFRDTATVMAIGAFDPSLRLIASDIVFTFPGVAEGTADNVWLPPDNVAFIVRSGPDNVMAFPRPDRFTAYYDNAASREPLDQSAVDNGVRVKARGYFRTSTIPGIGAFIDAFWISIGDPPAVGP